ncbi:hypothetical protein HMPREF9161_00800 [Selenomonas sp. F0473]|nr:hypothetical protein HMPREF9161_00800 [Selenomonas sp. F0473]
MIQNITRRQTIIAVLCALVLVAVGVLAYHYYAGT